jgi:hypothetical protein
MCQQWFSVIGLVLDVVGFLTIAWERHHMYTRDYQRRIAELEEAYKRDRATREGTQYEAPDEDAAMWRLFQKREEWRWRGRVFSTGVAVVILGFVGQLFGSWRGGSPAAWT